MMRTINSLFQESAEKNKSRHAFMVKDGKGYRGITYDVLAGMVRGFAMGLREIGIKRGEAVGLISENRYEWAVADLGLLHAGCVGVALFSTLPAGQVRYALEDSEAVAVIVSNEAQLEKIYPWAREKPGRKVIIMDGCSREEPDILSFDEVISMGLDDSSSDFKKIWQAAAPADMASIIYTSGTTGRPLGVVLSHRNIVAGIDAAVDAVAFAPGHVIVSFLPLNHVLARLADHYLPLSVGATIAYAGSLREIRPALLAIRPHYLILVPRVLDMFRDGILNNFDKAPDAQKAAFEKFLTAGMENLKLEESGEKAGAEAELLLQEGKKLVFSKIRESLGLDRLKFFVSGGAPLSTETAKFFRAMGLEVVEGYGLTETMALVTVNRPGFVKGGTVGPPVRGVEVRLSGEGEIEARGRGVMEGYWKRPAETARALDAEGWLKTGDMGDIDGDGYLTIRGRLKEIIVLSTGKNVAPQPIEERILKSPYVSQLIVTGDNRSAVTALIVVDFERVRGWLCKKNNNLDFSQATELSEREVAENSDVKSLIHGEIKRLSDGLAEFERVKRFALLTRPFSVEDGELTPTMKMRRKVIFEKYSDVINSLYR